MPPEMLSDDDRVKDWSIRVVTKEEQIVVARLNYLLTFGVLKLARSDKGTVGPKFDTDYKLDFSAQAFEGKMNILTTITGDNILIHDQERAWKIINQLLTLEVGTLIESDLLGRYFLDKNGHHWAFSEEFIDFNPSNQPVILTKIEGDSVLIFNGCFNFNTFKGFLGKFPNIARPEHPFIDLTEGGRFSLQIASI